MILDRLEEARRYHKLHPGFPAAFEFLRSTDLASLPVGKHPIDGDRLFLIIGQETGRGHAGAKLEAHRKYIDIQICLAGHEEIGWKPAADCRQVETPYSDERDILFFADAPDTWILLPCGSWMIFWPSDAHAPLAGHGEVHKAVVKVAVEWQ